jgi:hypothetical protein
VADPAVIAGASSIAHAVHYTVLGTGLLALVWLLVPGRRAAGDAHAVRVEALRELVAAGALAQPQQQAVAPPSMVRAAPARVNRLWLPLAVTSCTAAAGVHAAVGPAHFREETVVGLFFALAAAAQLLWSVAVVVRPKGLLIRFGVLGNVGLVALWAVSRTIGLPGLPPEGVGPWDLTCVVWELVAAIACLATLAAHRAAAPGLRVVGWADWDDLARRWATVSVIGLGLLSISGAGS